MSKVTLFVVTLVVLTASAAIVVWSFFGLGTKSPAINTSSQTNKEGANQSTESNTIAEKHFTKFTKLLPVKPGSPSVKTATVWYTFSGTVTGIRNNGENIELLTDITEPGLPQFLVTPKTQTFLLANGQNVATSAASIQANQKVDISMSYTLKQNAWDTVGEVKILNP